jgi:hypothetical protein
MRSCIYGILLPTLRRISHTPSSRQYNRYITTINFKTFHKVFAIQKDLKLKKKLFSRWWKCWLFLWEVTPSSLVEAYGPFRDSYCLSLRPVDGRNRCVYNYGAILPEYMASHYRRHVFRIVKLFLHSSVHKSKFSLRFCLLSPVADTTQNRAALLPVRKEARFRKYDIKFVDMIQGHDSGTWFRLPNLLFSCLVVSINLHTFSASPSPKF